MTLQKWVGIVISALSIFVIVVNIIYFDASDSLDGYWSIFLGAVSLIIFSTSIFIESIFMKATQCVLFFIVSIYAVISETDPVLIGIGFFFMVVGFELALCYRFFEMHPIPVIIGSLLGMQLFFAVLFHDIATAAAATAGISGCFSLLWAIRYYENRQVRRIAKEAIARGDEFKEELKERLKDGEVHR